MNKKTNIYRVFGLRRSGNHVFVKWLTAQLPGNVDFYNNIYLNDPILRSPDISESREGEIDNIILSYEDRNLDFAADQKWIKRIKGAHDAKVTDILLLRSPLNLFASRVRSKKIKPLYFSGMSIPELLFQYYTYQGSADEWKERFGGILHVVSFDDFISSATIREELAGDIGLRYVPVNLDEVDTRFGAGSSFSPGSEDAPPVSQLKSRWKQVKTDTIFLNWTAELLALMASSMPGEYETITHDLAVEGVSIIPVSRSKVNRYFRALVVEIVSLLRRSDVISAVRRSMRSLKS